MFCKNCGSEIGDDKKFCPQCGASTSNEKSQSNLNGISGKIGLFYKLVVILFEIFILSQSLVGCGQKGYQCFQNAFKPSEGLMLSRSNFVSGYTSGVPGIYLVVFVVITYLILLLLSFVTKEYFWKKHLHTNMFCTLSLLVAAILYKNFGDSSFQPTIQGLICVGISFLATIIYCIMYRMIKLDCKKVSIIKGFFIIFILFIVFMYVFGAVIPFVTGNIN